MFRKITAIVMSLFMIFGFLPVSAQEEDENGLIYDEKYSADDRLIPSVGTAESVCLLIDFPDQPHHTGRTAEDIDMDMKAYIHDSYETLSYGKLNFEVNTVSDWYTAAHPRNYYAQVAAEKGDEYARALLMKEAIAHFDSEVDFSEYDANQDGFIDEIFLLCAGHAYSVDFWWPCGNDCPYLIEADGVRPGKFAILDERNDYAQTARHEAGHGIGLQDLYDVTLPGAESFSVSDIMNDNNGDFNAYSKIMLGWIEPQIVSDAGKVVLKNSAYESDVAIVYPHNDTQSKQFFVIEYVGPDKAGVQRNADTLNGGLRIWRVNSDSHTNAHDHTPMIENVDWQTDRGRVTLDLGQNFYTSMWNGERDFTPYEYPSSYFYKGQMEAEGFEPSGISITDINPDGTDLSCNVSYEETVEPTDFTYELSYEVGNMLFAVMRFPVETYIAAESIRLVGEDGTEIPLTYSMETEPEYQRYTKLKIKADLTGHIMKKYSLEIPAGTLKNALNAENKDITEIIENYPPTVKSLNEINETIIGVSEVVALQGKLFHFKVDQETNNLMMMELSADNEQISSSVMMHISCEGNTFLKASSYHDEFMILSVLNNDGNAFYKVQSDGTYEQICVLSSNREFSHIYCEDELISLIDRGNDMADIVAVNPDSGKVRTVVSSVDLVSENVRATDHYVIIRRFDRGGITLRIYDIQGQLLKQVDFNDYAEISKKEEICGFAEIDGKLLMITFMYHVFPGSTVLLTAFDEQFNIIKRQNIYSSFSSSSPTAIYRLKNGYLIALQTEYGNAGDGNSGSMITGYATGLFMDEGMNHYASVMFEVPFKFDSITGIAEIGEEEYVISTPFQFMHVSLDQTPVHQHIAAEAVKENIVEPTCLEEGSYDEVVYCTECGEEISRRSVVIPALGHEWDEPVWTWDDNYTDAAAIFTCQRNKEHIHSEPAEVSFKTILPTSDEAGKTIYTAKVVFDGKEYTDEITVYSNLTIVCENPEQMESPHHYPDNCSDTWVYTVSGAENLLVTFDKRTALEQGKDYIVVLDGQGIEIGRYTGTELAGQRLEIKGDTAAVRLLSDESGNDWGFKVTEAAAAKTFDPVRLYGTSLALEGKIGINFYLNINEKDLGDLTVILTAGGSSIEIPAAEGTEKTVNDQKMRMYTYPVAAKEMREKVIVTIKDCYDRPVRLLKDEMDYTEGYAFSAADYFEKAEETGQQKTKELVRVIDNYGKYAQIYFDHNVTEEVKDTQDVSFVTAEELETNRTVISSEKVEGIAFAGGSTMLDDSIGFRLYFNVEDGHNINDFSFSINGSEAVPVLKKGSQYYIEIADIAAKDLGVMNEIAITDGINTQTIQYSALSYAYAALKLTGENKVPLQDLCRAMYLYNQQAIEYFGN